MDSFRWFTLLFSIFIFRCFFLHRRIKATMAGITPAQGRELLESGHMSDFLITCQGREIKTHKVILATVSDFFKLLFKHNFKVIKTSQRHPRAKLT